MPATENKKKPEPVNEPVNKAPENKPNAATEEPKITKEQVLEQFRAQTDQLRGQIAQRDKIITQQRDYIDSLLAERAELAASVARANSAVRLLATNAESSADAVYASMKAESDQFHKAIVQEKQRNESNK